MPEMAAAPVPLMVRAGAVVLTEKALPAGAELVSRSSSKVTVSVSPSTVALAKTGGLASSARTSRATALSPENPPVRKPQTKTSTSLVVSRFEKVWVLAETFNDSCPI